MLSFIADLLRVRRAGAAVVAMAVVMLSAVTPRAQEALGVDTALALAVDISDSVDDHRYRLQMEGIAQALEDESVLAAITSGPKGAIALALVEWADSAETTVDWQIVRNAADAARVAALIRVLPHRKGEYTCLARMMTLVKERALAEAPAAARKVLDVSGDGIDNCADATAGDLARDALVAEGVIINGLPIIVKGENDVVGSGAYRAPGYGLRELPRGPDTATTTLDKWFQEHVIGGPGAFVITAQGYSEFGKAFRQKFVTEVSGIEMR
jgi:hypothetical protein